MTRGQLVFLQCQLSRGGFSGERIFRLELADESQYVGVAPVGYCWRTPKVRLGPDEPAEHKSLTGFVIGKVIENGSNLVLIATPDGEAIKVSSDRTKVVPVERHKPDYVSI